MRIKTYKKDPKKGWVEIQEAYYWTALPRHQLEDRVAMNPNDQEAAKQLAEFSERISCPGCGRVMTRVNLNDRHSCSGILTDAPLAVRRGRYKQPVRSNEQKQKLSIAAKEYWARKNGEKATSDNT